MFRDPEHLLLRVYLVHRIVMADIDVLLPRETLRARLGLREVGSDFDTRDSLVIFWFPEIFLCQKECVKLLMGGLTPYGRYITRMMDIVNTLRLVSFRSSTTDLSDNSAPVFVGLLMSPDGCTIRAAAENWCFTPVSRPLINSKTNFFEFEVFPRDQAWFESCSTRGEDRGYEDNRIWKKRTGVGPSRGKFISDRRTRLRCKKGKGAAELASGLQLG